MVNMVDVPADSFVATALFFNSLSGVNDFDSAKRWKQTFVDIPKEYPHLKLLTSNPKWLLY